MKKLGIIGGLGPLASANLYTLITQLTPAQTDQEHIHIIIDSNINIPDRTKYIKTIIDNTNNQETPLIEIKKSIDTLENAGCDIIIMACNTAHYFENDIINYTKCKFISMPKVTIKAVKNKKLNTVCVLATDGTHMSNIYQKYLDKHNIKNLNISKSEQKLIMSIIYDYVKSGNIEKLCEIKKNIIQMIEKLKKQNCEAIILACTELPVAFKYLQINSITIINSIHELAKEAIHYCIDN